MSERMEEQENEGERERKEASERKKGGELEPRLGYKNKRKKDENHIRSLALLLLMLLPNLHNVFILICLFFLFPF